MIQSGSRYKPVRYCLKDYSGISAFLNRVNDFLLADTTSSHVMLHQTTHKMSKMSNFTQNNKAAEKTPLPGTASANNVEQYLKGGNKIIPGPQRRKVCHCLPPSRPCPCTWYRFGGYRTFLDFSLSSSLPNKN